MASEWIPLIIAFGVPILIKALDYFFPSGRHVKFVDRYSHEDHEDEDEAEAK